jgi:hypothetical protein
MASLHAREDVAQPPGGLFGDLVGNARGATARYALRLAERLTGRVCILLDYPPSAAGEPRYGYGRPPNETLFGLISARHEDYVDALRTIENVTDDLKRIERQAGNPLEPSWINDWLPGLDGAAIYAFLRDRRPAVYLEIGSGNSTLFADRARRDGQLPTRIVSVDPCPRAEIDSLCDEIFRQPLESVDLALFARLTAGDILFFDESSEWAIQDSNLGPLPYQRSALTD